MSTPWNIKSYSHANQTSPTTFQFLCMALAIDTIDGQSLSNEARHELRSFKEEQGNGVFAIHFTVKGV